MAEMAIFGVCFKHLELPVLYKGRTLKSNYKADFILL
jgi:hypothetical protein